MGFRECPPGEGKGVGKKAKRGTNQGSGYPKKMKNRCRKGKRIKARGGERSESVKEEEGNE